MKWNSSLLMLRAHSHCRLANFVNEIWAFIFSNENQPNGKTKSSSVLNGIKWFLCELFNEINVFFSVFDCKTKEQKSSVWMYSFPSKYPPEKGQSVGDFFPRFRAFSMESIVLCGEHFFKQEVFKNRKSMNRYWKSAFMHGVKYLSILMFYQKKKYSNLCLSLLCALFSRDDNVFKWAKVTNKLSITKRQSERTSESAILLMGL